MKQIQSFFLQCTVLLLLAFSSVADNAFSLFTVAAGSDEVISIESSLDNIDEVTSPDSVDGGDAGSDDDTSTKGPVFSLPPLASCPVSILTRQINNRSLHRPIPFYILYQSLTFYHPVA